MYLRPEVYVQEQPRSFDFNALAKDALLGDAFLFQDLMGSTSTQAAGFAAAATGTLSITIGAGRLYIQAAADANPVGNGSLPADSTQIMHQAYNAPQSVVLSTGQLAAGQSQYVLIEAGFSQTDAIAAGDPTNGILAFYNSANPAAPLSGPGGNGQTLPTVRQEQVVLKAVYGSPASTGSEVPPNADAGYVGLYMVDLAYGQTTISSGNILTCGPSAGTNVPSSYPAAPFIVGLAAKGQFSYLTATGGSRAFLATDLGKTVLRSNGGSLMTDTLPGTSGGVLPNGIVIVENADSSALYAVTAASGATLSGGNAGAGTAVILGPGQKARIASSGSNYYVLDAPGRVRLGANTTVYVNGSTGSDSNNGLASGSGAFATIQAAVDWWQDNVDMAGYQLSFSMVGACGPLQYGGAFVGQTLREDLVFTTSSAASMTNGSGAPTFFIYDGAQCFINGAITFTNTGGSSLIEVANLGATIEINGVILGATTASHLDAQDGGFILTSSGEGSYSHSPAFSVIGNAGAFIAASYRGNVILAGAPTITFTGALTITTTVACNTASYVYLESVNFVVGTSVTGKRYSVTDVSLIDTNGGGSSFIPGSTSGTATNTWNYS